ncbi:MAG: NirD/YgiW/YdeI family stress tolerance protein [Bacteroidales bacterium]|nr:NirD/YgiW/YdeI family stress tolerance protein [Bacteroidales bacterium]
MRKYLKMIAIAASLILFGEAYAQYTGPGTVEKLYSAKEIKDNASRLDKSDELVKIQGFIVKQLNNDTYEFKDNTGTLQVEIDKKRLPATPFNDKTEVILVGEVDHDLLESVEVEVKEVKLLLP